jgi:signal transduction histidine kinase
MQAGLEAAISWLAEEFKDQRGLTVEFTDDRQPKQLTKELRSYLYQAVRELLLNVARHAGTDRASVTTGREDDAIVVRVEDAGCGFDPASSIIHKQRAGGFGLFSVQQRSQYFGGSFTIESSPGHGTRATIIVPLDTVSSSKESRFSLPA